MNATNRHAALVTALYMVLAVLTGLAGLAVIGGLGDAPASASRDYEASDFGRPAHVQIV